MHKDEDEKDTLSITSHAPTCMMASSYPVLAAPELVPRATNTGRVTPPFLSRPTS